MPDGMEILRRNPADSGYRLPGPAAPFGGTTVPAPSIQGEPYGNLWGGRLENPGGLDASSQMEILRGALGRGGVADMPMYQSGGGLAGLAGRFDPGGRTPGTLQSQWGGLSPAQQAAYTSQYNAASPEMQASVRQAFYGPSGAPAGPATMNMNRLANRGSAAAKANAMAREAAGRAAFGGGPAPSNIRLPNAGPATTAATANIAPPMIYGDPTVMMGLPPGETPSSGVGASVSPYREGGGYTPAAGAAPSAATGGPAATGFGGGGGLSGLASRAAPGWNTGRRATQEYFG